MAASRTVLKKKDAKLPGAAAVHSQTASWSIGAIYGKPLTDSARKYLSDDAAWAVSAEVALRMFVNSFIQRLHSGMKQAGFSAKARAFLAGVMKIETRASSIKIQATHPAFKALLQGQKRKQMTYLQKARAPIPIITETGKLIFRSATAKSMKDGRWIHPGRKPSGVVERAMTEAKTAIKAAIQREIRKTMVKALGKK
jgi:hypothetical protein